MRLLRSAATPQSANLPFATIPTVHGTSHLLAFLHQFCTKVAIELALSDALNLLARKDFGYAVLGKYERLHNYYPDRARPKRKGVRYLVTFLG